MVVHTVLPDPLGAAVADVLAAAGIRQAAHDARRPLRAAEAAAGDDDAIALIGPFRSADVAEAVEATAPAGLPLLAPVATWAGVTRDDEPGCEDAARHHGTVLRMVARDTVVAQRIAADLRARGRRAVVVAGEHDYGRQLDGQLRAAGLPRSEDGDVVVLAGLAGEPEIARAAALAPLPVIAFDGVQGADLGPGRSVHVALPFTPAPGGPDLKDPVQRAAALVATAVEDGAADRAALLHALRALGPFDAHGDPVDPPVWLWRAGERWELTAEREL
jgi:hypothetical protein